MLRNTRGGAMPLVHGPHRVKSSIIEPQDALVNAAFLWALRSANAPASRAGTPASRSSTPLQRCRCSRCAREGRLRASESMGDRVWERQRPGILFGLNAPCAHSREDQAHRRLRATRGNPLAAPRARGRHAARARPSKKTQTNRGPADRERVRPPDAMLRSRSRLADASRALLTLLTDTMMNGQVRGGYTK